MGIKDLHKVLQREQCTTPVCDLSLFNGARFAIDISIYLNKYLRSSGEEKWLNSFIFFLCILKKNNIKAVCVFDGKGFPPEKTDERNRRRKIRQQSRDKMYEAIEFLKILDQTPDQLSNEQMQRIRTLLGKLCERTDFANMRSVYQQLREKIQTWNKQTAEIKPEYIEQCKEIINNFGLASYQASGEAETLCCYLNKKGFVDFVLTEDTDILSYGAVMLCKWDSNAQQVRLIQHQTILQELGFSEKQFRDLCILLGCDYNKRCCLKPKKQGGKPIHIGAVRAFSLIEEYKNLDALEPYLHNPEVLNFRKCRELFTIPEELEEIIFPLNKSPSFEKIGQFLKTYSLHVPLSYIKTCWKKTEIVFEL